MIARAAGACVVVAGDVGRPARLLHYGADVGDVDEAALELALSRALLPSSFDEPVTLGLLPTESDGWFGRPGLAAHRGGTPLFPRWRVESIDVVDPSAVVLRCSDESVGLALGTTLRLEASGVLRVRHTLRNTGDDVVDVGAVEASIPLPPIASEVLDFSGRWSKERVPLRTPLAASRIREVRRGRPGHDSPLLMVVGMPGFGFGRGEVWCVHVEWSGNAVYCAERPPEGAGPGAAVLGGGELLRAGEVRLAPGEEHTTPWVLFSWSPTGLDGASTRIHRYLRGRASHPRRARPLVLNTWEAVYFDHDLERLRALARTAAEIGVERFVLDDGWFRGRRDDTAGLGDWEVDGDVWPAGLHRLFDDVRALGMEVGLWVEPEMVNLDSDLAREHPDWVIGPTLAWRHQQVLDVARLAVADHLFTRLDALVREYRLDFLKWDHNRDVVAADVHRQTTAVYALLDRLRAAHPALEIESCASGGGRVDLGVLARSDRVWASDTTDAIERQDIQRWTSLLIPPELIGAHVGPPTAPTTGRRVGLVFRCLTALVGHAGIEWDVTQCSERELAHLASWVRLYKELRPLLHSGDVVHADDEPEGLRITGVVSADGAAAVHVIARVASGLEAAPGPLRLPGLDAARTYRVRVRGDFFDARRRQRRPPAWWDAACADGFEIAGSALTTVGLQFPALMPADGLLLQSESVSRA